ncbi:phosphate-regulating neutral endopeptidase PHEX-like, partial [Ruditapes philippinarum]|uniref:phosphate-regulating neutral endopeptidase PHEX-like n=1 Tax=Ruditapes philippinarum TaxID=129788 RepID=UPI00295AD76F
MVAYSSHSCLFLCMAYTSDSVNNPYCCFCIIWFKGRNFDKEGKQRTWWLQRDVDKFKRKTQCFIDMWSNFTIPGTGGMKNNGELTLNEVLSDHEGTRISYKAYRRIIEKQQNGKEEKRLPGLPYTPNQLFFINLVQPFCTNIRNDMKKYWIQNVAHPLSLI